MPARHRAQGVVPCAGTQPGCGCHPQSTQNPKYFCHTEGFPARPFPGPAQSISILSREMPGWADLSSPESSWISPDPSLCSSTDQKPPKPLLFTMWFVIIQLGVTVNLINPPAPRAFCHQQLSTGEGSKIIPFLCAWSCQKYHSTERDQWECAATLP